MRRTASEIIRDLESRVAHLESAHLGAERAKKANLSELNQVIEDVAIWR